MRGIGFDKARHFSLSLPPVLENIQQTCGSTSKPAVCLCFPLSFLKHEGKGSPENVPPQAGTGRLSGDYFTVVFSLRSLTGLGDVQYLSQGLRDISFTKRCSLLSVGAGREEGKGAHSLSLGCTASVLQRGLREEGPQLLQLHCCICHGCVVA